MNVSSLRHYHISLKNKFKQTESRLWKNPRKKKSLFGHLAMFLKIYDECWYFVPWNKPDEKEVLPWISDTITICLDQSFRKIKF